MLYFNIVGLIIMDDNVSKKVSKRKVLGLLGGFFRPIPFKLFISLFENCVEGGGGLALHRLSRRIDITYSHSNLLVNRLFIGNKLFVCVKIGRENVLTPTNKGKALYNLCKGFKALGGVKK